MGFGLAFKIAWRNLWRHRGKSLIIGVILLFGTTLMTVGNGIISGMEKGLSVNIVNLFTGDIVLISNEQKKDDVLLSFDGKPLKVIKGFDGVKKILNQDQRIAGFLPATAGMVYVFNSGSELGNIMLLGVDIDRYRKLFPDSITITKGRLFKPGEPGLLVSAEARKQAYELMDFWLQPEDVHVDKNELPSDAKTNPEALDIRNDLVFMGASTSNDTLDVKVPVKGIMNYKSLNKIWGLYCIVDIDSFRQAHNYLTGTEKVEISKANQELFADDNLDQLLSGNDMVDNSVKNGASFSAQDLQTATHRQTMKYNPDAGSYNLALVKLKPGVPLDQALKELNRNFKQNHLNVRAISWKSAIGAFGSMAALIKGALNLFIMFIFFVAIIVIMNTLSMAAMERVSEIGMMRAIGARKGFLYKMFTSETGILAFSFGGIGIIIGIILIYLLKAANITTSNEILQLIYGGDRLNPLFTLADLFIGIVELAIVTCLSVLYPLRVVGKIVPLDAISRE